MADQGFVFISHSHKDIATVRRIRNKLESLGFEPLLFYLKCLSDEGVVHLCRQPQRSRLALGSDRTGLY